MTEKEILCYLEFADHRVSVMVNYSGVGWKPKYEELKNIDRELVGLRTMVGREHVNMNTDEVFPIHIQ